MVTQGEAGRPSRGTLRRRAVTVARALSSAWRIFPEPLRVGVGFGLAWLIGQLLFGAWPAREALEFAPVVAVAAAVGVWLAHLTGN